MTSHAKAAVPARVVVLDCPRCGMSWNHVQRPGGQPTYCPECRPLAYADNRERRCHAATRTQNWVEPRWHKTRRNWRRRLNRRGLTHAWQGLTDQQWVDRWHDRPDLFLELVKGLERSVARHPDLAA